MRFQHYDALRVFALVARHGSFSAAAGALNLTKGAVSYQIKVLEQALGFALFHRQARGVALTAKARDLAAALQLAFETVETRIDELRTASDRPITIGTTTYFASRWLSPRLMLFMKAHPKVRLRIQPMIDLANLRGEGVDIAIRWGRGGWSDLTVRRLFACPAFATGAPAALDMVRQRGLAKAMAALTLLDDRDGSPAWSDWHRVAGLTYRARADALTVPDPNVRVQAVIDGQGVALNDALVQGELDSGRLVRLSAHQLDDYGYFLVHEPGALANPDVAAFADWILSTSAPE